MTRIRGLLDGAAGVLAAGAFAAVSVLTFWVVLPSEYRIPESSDYESFYEPVARSILEGRGPVLSDGALATRYPPGYSAILAGALGFAQITGMSEACCLQGLIILCFAGAAMLLFMIARDVWGSEIGFLVPVTISTYPFALWLTREPLSEMTFFLALAAVLWLFWNAVQNQGDSRWMFFASGLAAGAAMLIRPAGIGLPLVLAFLAAGCVRVGTTKSRVVTAGMIVAGAFLAILPWEIHVYSETGRVIPLSTGGPSSVLDGVTFAVREKYYHEKNPVPDAIEDLMTAVNRQYPPGGGKRDVGETILREALRNPLGMVGLAGWKTARCWYGTDSQRHDRLAAVLQVPYLVLLTLSFATAFRMGGRARLLAVIALTVLCYFWVVTIAVLSIVRYMVPAVIVAFLVVPAPFVRRSLDNNNGLA